MPAHKIHNSFGQQGPISCNFAVAYESKTMKFSIIDDIARFRVDTKFANVSRSIYFDGGCGSLENTKENICNLYLVQINR